MKIILLPLQKVERQQVLQYPYGGETTPLQKNGVVDSKGLPGSKTTKRCQVDKRTTFSLTGILGVAGLGPTTPLWHEIAPRIGSEPLRATNPRTLGRPSACPLSFYAILLLVQSPSSLNSAECLRPSLLRDPFGGSSPEPPLISFWVPLPRVGFLSEPLLNWGAALYPASKLPSAPNQDEP